MVDWAYGFDRQSFEYWRVDPSTWLDAEPFAGIVSGSLVRDSSAAHVTSATLEVAGEMPAEAVVRCYMAVEQSGARERVPIDTWVAYRTARTAGGSLARSKSALYGPLHVLANRERDLGSKPPYGYTVPAGANCAYAAADALSHGIAPVTAAPSEAVLGAPYVAGGQQSWGELAAALAAMAAREVTCGPTGALGVDPVPVPGAVRPSWTFHDGNSTVKSNILAEASEERSTMNVPNVVEVVWDRTSPAVVARAEDDDPAHAVSTASRGYELVRRVLNPAELQAGADAERAAMVAAKELAAGRQVVRVITVAHPYCPARVGDVVEVDYRARGIAGVGRVARQTMSLAVGGRMTSVIHVTEEV